MAEPTNAEIEKAARVLVRSCEGSTSRVPGWLRALVDACDDRDRARAQRDEAMQTIGELRDQLRARDLFGPRDND